MEIALFCTCDSHDALTGIIKSKGFVINNNAEIAIVEKGLELPHDVLAIVFELRTLSKLIDILDLLVLNKEGTKDTIIGKKGDKYEIVNLDKIKYFESDGNDVYCFTNNERLNVKSRLYELEVNLFNRGFIRISKSTIVNIIAIKEIIPWFDSKIILKLKDNIQLEVSKKYCRDFKEFIGL